jgi:alkylation response protein AidB-like acyl-CoA dehydrogenase
MKDAGQNFVKEAAMAKLYSSRAAERITSKAIEMYGGYGYVKIIRREVLARFQDWRDLRGHLEHAVTNNREVDYWEVSH